MPYGLPAATVLLQGGHFETEDREKEVFVSSGTHVQPLYVGADQDGWQGEVIVAVNNQRLAVPKNRLRL